MNVFHKKSSSITVILLFFILWLMFFGSKVQATDVSETGESGFYFSNILPDNQLSEGEFFDLLVKPGQEQVLATEIVNDSDEEMTITVKINNAKTNKEGLIEYGQNKLKNTGDATYELTDLLTGPSEIKLKGNERKVLKLALKVPNEQIPGVILGGVELQEKEDEKKIPKGVTVRSEFVYTYSISLQMSEKKIAPQLSLNPAKYSIQEGKQLITVSINNERSTVMTGMIVESLLMTEESDQIIAEFKIIDGKMAPNSILEAPIEVENIKPGQYRLKTTVSCGETEWSWEQKINITEKEVKKEEVLAEPVSEKPAYFGGLILIMTLVCGVAIIYYVIRK